MFCSFVIRYQEITRDNHIPQFFIKHKMTFTFTDLTVFIGKKGIFNRFLRFIKYIRFL